MASRIFIVEDHELVREMLEQAIEMMDGLSVSGSAASGEEALGRLPEVGTDLVLADMALPGMNGAELVGALRERHPEITCLIFSGHREASYVDRALRAGARGYVLKGDPYELEGALRQVLAGEMYLSEPIRKQAGKSAQ